MSGHGNLSDVLSWRKPVQCERDMSRVTPRDDGDSGPVWSDIQSLDNIDNELCHVTPAFCVHCSGRV